MDFLIESLKNFDFWGSLPQEMKSYIGKVELPLGVEINKTNEGFFKWCEEHYKHTPQNFNICNITYEYCQYLSEQLTPIIQNAFNKHPLEVSLFYEDGDICMEIIPEIYSASREVVEYAKTVDKYFL